MLHSLSRDCNLHGVGGETRRWPLYFQWLVSAYDNIDILLKIYRWLELYCELRASHDGRGTNSRDDWDYGKQSLV